MKSSLGFFTIYYFASLICGQHDDFSFLLCIPDHKLGSMEPSLILPPPAKPFELNYSDYCFLWSNHMVKWQTVIHIFALYIQDVINIRFPCTSSLMDKSVFDKQLHSKPSVSPLWKKNCMTAGELTWYFLGTDFSV